jgi:hypothetical protein
LIKGDVEVAAARGILQVDILGIALADVGPRQAADGSSASRCAGGVDILGTSFAGLG